MTHLLQRDIAAHVPTAVRGEGIYLYDKTGKRYIDATSGPAVACLGHGDAEIESAMAEQLGKLAYVTNQFFTTEAAETLADVLVEGAPDGIAAAWIVCGGSEAIESALKFARQYFVEIGEPERRRFIARRQSFHGSTLAALSVGGHAQRRATYAPLLIECEHVSPCYAYRGLEAGESMADYGRRLADELEQKLLELGPETVCAFVAETVVGAALGTVPPVEGYFAHVRAVCEKYGVLLILDEIMCGMGRTGTLHACEAEGISADMIVVGKGLAAGFQPAGAVLISERVKGGIAEGSGIVKHGFTYMAHPVACAAALAVQRAIAGRDLLANVRRQGEVLRQRLESRFGNHPFVGDIRGRGLFWALELVRDRGTKEPFEPALALHARVKAESLARGLICYPGAGTADGERGDHVIISPPFIVTETEIDEIVELLGDALDAALASVGV